VVIGVPLFNGARHFEVALPSILAQSGPSFAVVMVDDRSTDRTPELASELAARDPRVSFRVNPDRLGLARNWQRCFELAAELHPEAEYFAWGSDHDIWEPGWLVALTDALDSASQCVLAYPHTMRISEDGRDVRSVRAFETRGVTKPLARLLTAGVGMSAGNMVYGLFRRSALARAGGFPRTLLPDRLLLLRLALLGEFHQVPRLLWRRRLVGPASLERQRQALWPHGAPWWTHLPVELLHGAAMLQAEVARSPGREVGRARGLAAATTIVVLRAATKSNRRRLRHARLRLWRMHKRAIRMTAKLYLRLCHARLRVWRMYKRLRRMLTTVGEIVGLRPLMPPRTHGLPQPVVPEPAAVAEAARRSPLNERLVYTTLADPQELRFREEIEPSLRNEDMISWLLRKETIPKLAYVLRQSGVTPRGTVVELGAGSCWLSAALAALPEVDRAIAVEFSRRRLTELAPVALAALGPPPEKVERVLADFNDPGLPDGCADLVVTDAAFHHAADREALARVAFRLLRPGGTVLLTREPTLALLRRSRDHGLEGRYGSFEHEETAEGYEQRLRAAGFADVRRVSASGGFESRRDRALLHPPLAWLNGIAFAEYAYLGRRPIGTV
jgi:SAM-dependent methyltransferase